MAVAWKNHSARKLLKKDLENGVIPIDSKEMGPRDVYNKYKDNPAFQNIEYDATFTRHLRELRKKLSEQQDDEGIDWRNSAAKLYQKIVGSPYGNVIPIGNV